MPVVNSPKLPVAMAAPLNDTEPALVSATLAALIACTTSGPALFSVRLPPAVVVPRKEATWLGPIRLVSPPDVVVSAFARTRPFAFSVIALPALRLTSPVVRIAAGAAPPLSWMPLPAVMLMLPPPGGTRPPLPMRAPPLLPFRITLPVALTVMLLSNEVSPLEPTPAPLAPVPPLIVRLPTLSNASVAPPLPPMRAPTNTPPALVAPCAFKVTSPAVMV